MKRALRSECRLVAFALGIAMTACSSPHDDVMRPQKVAVLKQGVAAEVGSEVVTIEQVRILSEAAQIPIDEAVSRLAYDALFAAEARARGYDGNHHVIRQHRAVLTQAILDRIQDEVVHAPISDEELSKHTELHWLDIDRPVARSTVHAVVVPGNLEDAADWERAEAVARRIADAVRGERDAKQFKDLANGVDGDGLKVIVQDLPPVTADGREADLKNRPPSGVPASTFDPLYVRAMFALHAVGDQVAPVRSSFGVHVVMLTGTQEARQLDVEDRRSLLAEEIRAARVRGRLDNLLATLRERTPPRVERSVEEMLNLVPESLFEATGRGR